MAVLMRMSAVFVSICGLAACQPELTVGERSNCPADSAEPPPPAMTDPIAMPWSTGFEDEFCGYTNVTGFCYINAQASYDIVATPVHTGRYAAAFSVDTSNDKPNQTRCVRQGILPKSAVYGAWYFVPELADTNGKTWNLFHFQGGDVPAPRLDTMWDVGFINDDNGDLELVVFDGDSKMYRADDGIPVPIGQWFHIEMLLKRATDASGEVALYQDGTQLIDITGMPTDDDPAFTQWYVGSWSDGLTPPTSTLYVDDVSIRAER